MALRQVNGDVVLASAARTATTNSDPIAAPGAANLVVCGAHVSAASGTGPTLNVKLQQSNDGSTGWTDIPGSTSATLSAAGNASASGVATDDFVRVVLTIGGTTPSFTCSAWVMLAAE